MSTLKPSTDSHQKRLLGGQVRRMRRKVALAGLLDLHPDRERRDRRAPHPHAAGAVPKTEKSMAEGGRGDRRWAKVVAYDPVRRVGRLKLAEGGRDLQFFLRVLEGRLKRQVVEASKQLWMERRKVAGDPGFREVVQGVKDPARRKRAARGTQAERPGQDDRAAGDGARRRRRGVRFRESLLSPRGRERSWLRVFGVRRVRAVRKLASPARLDEWTARLLGHLLVADVLGRLLAGRRALHELLAELLREVVVRGAADELLRLLPLTRGPFLFAEVVPKQRFLVGHVGPLGGDPDARAQGGLLRPRGLRLRRGLAGCGLLGVALGGRGGGLLAHLLGGGLALLGHESLRE